jgi:Flp pilus assembly protein TadD
MAITLPLLWLAYDLLRRFEPQQGDPFPVLIRRLGVSLTRALRESRLFYLACFLAAGVAGLYLIFVEQISNQKSFYGGTLDMTLLTTSRIVVHYIKLLLLPATLSADYSYDAFPVTSSWADPRAWLALCVLTLIVLGLWRLASFCKVAAFGGLWFFITLLPVYQIIPHHELMAEHYLYLPSVGVAFLVGTLLDRWARAAEAGRRLAIGVSAAMLLLGARTVVRNLDWKDELTLWAKTVQTAPACGRAHYNLGTALLDHGEVVGARRELQAALQLRPDLVRAHNQLGYIAQQEKRYEEARQEYEAALKLDPGFLDARVNLASLAILHEQLDIAKSHLELALRSDPAHSKVRYHLGLIYAKQGKLAEARREFEIATSSDPAYVLGYRALGIVAIRQGDLAAAAQAFEEVVRLRPDSAEDRYKLGLIYRQQGSPRGAQREK